MPETAETIAPRMRENFLGAEGLEAQLAGLLNAGALANGWLISGGEGIGKATLAFRLARALLWRERPQGAPTLEAPANAQAFSLVASGAHPDLFVAERAWDEKKERYATEISVDVIRDLTHFLSHTASMGGWRVAIVDTAEDLNRNSANALLKVLEEPPPRTAMFVLTSAPGRLLATIRSRCRRIHLRPLSDAAIADFLVAEGAADRIGAGAIAAKAGGRPGFALSLAQGEGAHAITLADEFWTAASAGRDVTAIAQKLTLKNADAVWSNFSAMLVGRLAEEARERALGGDGAAAAIVELRTEINSLFVRGDAVNLDRMQMAMAAGRSIAAALAARS